MRFLIPFTGFLLLINPKFIKEAYTIEKAHLIIAVDNSTSIKNLDGTSAALDNLDRLKSNPSLLEKFEINSYSFGNSIREVDSIKFDAKITNISSALNSLNEIYGNSKSALILLSDGNQTLGLDYEYQKLDAALSVFPIVIGDTTTYEDLRVASVNANKYAFLKNKFPIETSISYSGERSINSMVKIYLNGKQVFRQALSFSKTNTNTVVNALLEASDVGIKSLKVQVDELSNEKNTLNNSKELVIEVIDEKTNVGLISSIIHPDIGALKKSIEANEQREVQILKPNASVEILENIDVFILYQPNTTFKSIYDFIGKLGGGVFTITGSKTDWNFLNDIQSSFSKENYNQTEEILPIKDSSFPLFDISDLSFEGYPPLESELGDLVISKSYETIASQRIKGIDLDSPLFLIVNDEESKEAVLFGENIWKWRVQAYRNERTFKTFDDFMGKVLLYLSDVKQKSRLDITYESLYEESYNAKVSASYFDNSYTFDPNAKLTLKLKKQESDFSRELPMLLKGNTYEASLDALEAGNYQFTVIESKNKISKSGRFKILDSNLEDQFLAADYDKLARFSKSTNGGLYFPEQLDSLIENLLSDNRFTPVQKSNRNVVSLIDFRYLLILMVFALGAEWFIRKYNGLL
ncbi:VWA domain-containing protein [uncultured Croceitalea sp.]|uniref:VWA domain-containing protein n=1 Tax=uncultured Croceitalea sp. TaxID=1798908 RepID=UPI003306341C